MRGANFTSWTSLGKVTEYSRTAGENLGTSFPGLTVSLERSQLSITNHYTESSGWEVARWCKLKLSVANWSCHALLVTKFMISARWRWYRETSTSKSMLRGVRSISLENRLVLVQRD